MKQDEFILQRRRFYANTLSESFAHVAPLARRLRRQSCNNSNRRGSSRLFHRLPAAQKLRLGIVVAIPFTRGVKPHTMTAHVYLTGGQRSRQPQGGGQRSRQPQGGKRVLPHRTRSPSDCPDEVEKLCWQIRHQPTQK